MATTTARTDKLDLRVSPDAKLLLQRAATASRCSLSEFVLESALARAEETLPDRRRFELDPERWAAFQLALDAAPTPLPRLAALLAGPSVFDPDPAQ